MQTPPGRAVPPGKGVLLRLSENAGAWLRPTLPWVVLVACVAASVVATLHSLRRQWAAEEIRFSGRVNAVQQGLVERLDRNVGLLRGAAGLLATSRGVGPGPWHLYFEHLQLSQQFKGVQAVGYIERVRRTEADRWLADVRRAGSGWPGFTNFQLWPLSSRGSGYIVKLVEPLQQNLPVLGFDIGTEEVRRHAAEAALDTGQPRLTAPVQLLQRPSRTGVLLLLPVYESDSRPADLAQRRAQLRGWVYSALLTDQLIRGLRRLGGPTMALEVYDGLRLSPAVSPDSRARPAVLGRLNPFRSRELSRDIEMELAGRVWTLRFSQRPGSAGAGGEAAAPLVAGGGLCISLLVFATTRFLLTSQQRAAALAERMTHELRLQERAMAASNDGILILAATGTYPIIYSNRAFTQITGYSQAELLGASLAFLLEGELNQPGVSRVLEALRAGREARATLRESRKEGGPLWIELRLSPVRNEAGAATHFLAIIQDITKRKRAQEALRKSQQRFALAVQGTNDGLWDWNVLTNEVYFAPRWKAMLGYEDGEIENAFSGWERLVHPEDRPRALTAIQSYLRRETATYHLEHRLRHKNGSYRWILARGVAVWDRQGNPLRMAGSHLDLTERKSAEEQLRRANADLASSQESLKAALANLEASHEELKTMQLQLIQAAKLESIGTLAAGVAHEVKNPLQIILLGLEYLGDALGPNPQRKVEIVLTDMRDAVQRANAIIRELLQLAAVTDLELKAEDLNALAERALWLVKYEAEASQVRIIKNLGPGLPPVLVDHGKLEQAIINVLLNAIQAMSQGGVLVVRTWVEPALLAALAPGQGESMPSAVALEITDNGPGIPPEHLARVFDPFFTTKPAGVGTGLGLFIVKSIAELHRAVLEVDNAPGAGTRVKFTLTKTMGLSGRRERSVKAARGLGPRPEPSSLLPVQHDTQTQPRAQL